MFIFQNSSIERQTFVKTVSRFYEESKICLAGFGHIFIVTGTILSLIEQQNIENELKKSISRPLYRKHVGEIFHLYIHGL